MANRSPTTAVLVIDDDPGSAARISTLCKPSGKVSAHFADTPNAVSRTLEAERIAMVVMFFNENNIAMAEGVARQCNRQAYFMPLVAVVDLDQPDQLVAAVEAGAGCIVDGGDHQRLGAAINRELGHIEAHREAVSNRARLEEIEDRYTLLLDSSREAIAYVHEGLHIYANGAYLELFGHADSESLEGMSILDLLTSDNGRVDLKALLRRLDQEELPDGNVQVEAVRADGSRFKASVTFSPARYSGENCIQMMVREQQVESDPALQEELLKLRTTDSLTGFLNRQTFIERVDEIIASLDENQETALLLLELVDQEQLVEKVGMGAADALVAQTAGVLTHLVDAGDLIGRVTDHSFALLISRDDREAVEQTARQLLDTYSGHILEVRDKALTVAAAVGLTYLGPRSRDAGEALSQADSALSEAMRASGNCFVRYRPRLAAVDGAEDSQWAERIRHALDNNEFFAVEQPVIDMEQDEPVFHMLEARLRPDNTEELHLPEAYMAAAVRTGLAAALDKDLIERLLQRIDETDAGAWMVPLSTASLADEAFVEWFQKKLDDGELPGNRLVLRFLEIEVRDNLLGVQRFMQRLLARGCRFAIAEVGRDSHLDQLLKHLDFDFVMMRQELVEDLSSSDERREALRELSDTVREKNVRLIAPRVANAIDLASLWHYGITLVQGDFVQDEVRAVS